MYKPNDKYSALLTAGYTVDDTTLYVSAVPTNVPTIVVAAKGTDNETVFAVTGKTTNSLTGVTRLKGADVDLDAQTPLTCLNNEEFITQFHEAATGKASGAEIDTGTEDAKIVTPKAIADSNLSFKNKSETISGAKTFSDDITIADDKDIKFASGAKIERSSGDLKFTPEAGKDVLNVMRTKARAYLATANQENIPTATATVVTLNAESYDIGSDFDTGTYKFTAPVTGYYVVSAAICWVTSTVIADCRYGTILRKNGNVDLSLNYAHSSNVDYLSVPIGDIIYLAANDYLQLIAAIATGVNTCDIQFGTANTFMAVHLLSVDS